MAHVEAIVLSMTPEERKHPEIIKATRKQRIARVVEELFKKLIACLINLTT